MRASIIALSVTLLGVPAAGQTEIGDLSSARGIEIAGEVTHVFGNRFVVADGTGSVLVETGPPWHHQITVRLGERVRVRGEPDLGGFDAFEIIRANGEALQIRPAGGPPPWAGGPGRRGG